MAGFYPRSGVPPLISELLVVLVIAMNWLTGCPTEGFDHDCAAACPPVVEYSREIRNRATEELALLPDGSAVVEMMGDYAVMRDQARACSWSAP